MHAVSMIAFLEAVLHILIVAAATDDKVALHLPRKVGSVPYSSTPEVRGAIPHLHSPTLGVYTAGGGHGKALPKP